MSRLINQEQYQALLCIRSDIFKAIRSGNTGATQHGLGMAQGYLIGLRDAGEIDDAIMNALEAETFNSVDFMLNARRAANAHPA